MKQSNERLSFSVFSKTLRHSAPLWWAYWIKAPAAVMENESGAVAYAPAPREKQEKWKSPPVLLGSIFIGRKPDFRSVTLDLQQTPTAHRGRQACRHWVSFLYFFLSICSCMLCFISPSLYLCCLAFCFCPYLPPALIDIPPSKHGESALSSSRKKKKKKPIELLCRLFKSLLFQCGEIISSLKVCRIKRHFLITVQRYSVKLISMK